MIRSQLQQLFRSSIDRQTIISSRYVDTLGLSNEMASSVARTSKRVEAETAASEMSIAVSKIEEA